MASNGCAVYEFGNFQLDPVDRTLSGAGGLLPLSPKAVDLLLVLVSNAGRIVDKERLMREVWPGTFVEENNLTVTISAIRKVLGEASAEQRYIQTVPRRGYRFAVAVREAKGPKPPSSRPTSGTREDAAILVGRETELCRLEALLSQAAQGAGQLVLISGEPGIGKTALSHAFIRKARLLVPGIRISRGRCLEQYGPGESYLPFLDSISDLLSAPDAEDVADLLRSRAPTWCLRFPAVFSSNGALEGLYRETVGATKERMLREIVDALETLAAAAPLVLHIEDLHWADPASIDLLGRLCRAARTHPLLVVGTFRPEDVERGNRPLNNLLLEMQSHNECEEIPLGLLEREHVAAYLNKRFPLNGFEPELAALIHRKTEGQPLFATSLLEFLAQRGDIANVSERWTLTRRLSELGLEAPLNVRKFIRRKLDALEADDRRVLEYASIQGAEFNSTLIAGLLQIDDLDVEERLDRVVKMHRLIRTVGEDELPDGTLCTRYRFTHVLYQNALYEGLVTKRRVLLHRQTGDLMLRICGGEAQRFATQLAVHFERGRDFDRAVEFLIHAGDNAREIHANEKAVQHYSRALEFVPRASRQQASAPAAIYQKRGAAYLAMGQFDDAIDDFGNLLRHVRAMGDRLKEHGALNALAEVFFYAHRLDELMKCAGEALAIAEELGDLRLRAETMVYIAMKQDIVGELADARRNLDEIIGIARKFDHKSALLNALAWRGHLHFFQSEYIRAREVLLDAVDLASELRHGPLLLQTKFFLALALANMGSVSESLNLLRNTGEMARRNGDHYWEAKIPNCIAWIYRELEDTDQALKIDREGLELARASKVREAETNSLINLGCVHAAGDPQAALGAFQQAATILDDDVWCRWRFRLRLFAGLASHHLSQGELTKADEYARALLDSATVHEARKYVAIAYRLLAEIAVGRNDLDTAGTRLQAALDVLVQFPAPLVEWRIYSLLGRLHLSWSGGGAHEAIERAAHIVQAIAAQIEEESLRASFLAAPSVRDLRRPTARMSSD